PSALARLRISLLTFASGGASMRFIDSDGHVLEHPDGMLRYAPKGYEDRIWHIETDARGREWMIMDEVRMPANGLALAGTAGMSDEDRGRAQRGELRYTEVRPAAYNAKARLEDMAADGIDQSVVYPTFLLGIQSHRDVDFATAQCRAYNDWVSDHVSEGDGRLFAAAVLPQQDLDRAAAEIRRAAELPGVVAVFIRPNPTADWKQFNDPVYDPIWRAASDTGLPVGLHPFLAADLPGACIGMHFNRLGTSAAPLPEEGGADVNIDNIYFTQALSNPFDMMSSMAFLLAAVRRRPHHLGVGLPASRRQVPGCDGRAGRGHRGPDQGAAGPYRRRERRRPLRAVAEAHRGRTRLGGRLPRPRRRRALSGR